jgi:DNA-binding transcriptional LysR family regulator
VVFLDINALKYFFCTYHERNISKAAQMQYLSQQGLSKAIQALDVELGVPLFRRTKTGVVPTKFGDALYEQVKEILNNYSNMIQIITELKGEKKGVLKVGLANSMAAALEIGVPLLDFMSLYPDIQIENTNESDSNCEKMLLEGSLDIAFLMAPVSYSQIHTTYLMSDNICAVVNKKHRLSDRTELTISDIKDEPILCADKSNKGYDVILRIFREMGYRPNILFTSNEPLMHYQFVRQNAGVVISPSAHWNHNFRDEDRPFVIIPLKTEPGKILIAYNDTRLLTPNEKLFVDYFVEYYKCDLRL